MKPILHLRRMQRGMTLIELAVGLVIALLVSLAAAGSAQMFTASQRQSMSTGSATMNVASTLAAVKDDVAGAGLGFFGGNRYLCDTLNLSLNNTVLSNGGAFSPLVVARGASNDTITIVYGDDVAAGANVMLRGDSPGTSAWLRSLLPVSLDNGQTPAVLMMHGKGGLCTVRTVTGFTPPDAVSNTAQQLTFGGDGLHNKFEFAQPPNYTANEDFVALLGKLNWHTYAVNADGELVMTRVIDGDTAVLSKDVVAFRVQLGVADDPAKPRLDRWVEPKRHRVPIAAAVGRIADRSALS